MNSSGWPTEGDGSIRLLRHNRRASVIELLDVLRGLRGITATPGRGCTRIAYTHLEDQAHDYVWEQLRTVPGLARLEDAAGNTFIVPAQSVGTDTPVLLVGSHLDTVVEGGWLDGALGVAAGAHVLQQMAGAEGAHQRLGLVVFRDEEGVRFDTGLFGSSVFAGRCETADLDVADREGIRVRDVVPNPDGCCAYEPPVHPAAFLECHIEQGGRLVASGTRIGVVTGIVGIRRFELVATGMANHAGTTEMTRRVDALVPVAEAISRLPSLVEDLEPAVVTCGRVDVEPGAPNIVPGTVRAILEIRAGDAATLDILEGRLRALVADLHPAALATDMAQLTVRPVVSVMPTPTDATVVKHLADTLNTRGVAWESLPSMAGHDTQNAVSRCPAAMFFIPSIDGVSHNPAEDSAEDDIRLAGDVMLEWAQRALA